MLLHERSMFGKFSVTHITSHSHAGAQSLQLQSSAPSYAPVTPSPNDNSMKSK